MTFIGRMLGAVLLVIIAGPARLPAQAAPADSAQLALGKRIFQGRGLCFSCHGMNGEGALGPTTRLAGRAPVHVKAELAAVVDLIKQGVDSAHSSIGQVMPPRGGGRLTDDEVRAVASYVLKLISEKMSQ
ncbi:MAG: c-type cytochrome [Gemmatimonadales bacterium]